jgi:hypothetical protein
MFNEDDDTQSPAFELAEPDTVEEDEGASSDELKIKYYTVDLPSEGKLGYPETIEYRDILVRDEKVLSSATAKNYNKILNQVLKSLLKDQSLYEDLTIHDRDFLLLWIWANNYKTEKKFDVYCPVCTNKDTVEVNLAQMEIDHIHEKFKNPYPMTLENGDQVTLKLLTVKDERIAENFAKANNMRENDVKLALSINFPKVVPLKQKIEYIDNHMKGRDMARIRGFHDYFKYGVHDRVDHECTECGEVTQHIIPFSVEFLLPTLSGDFEEEFSTGE